MKILKINSFYYVKNNLCKIQLYKNILRPMTCFSYMSRSTAKITHILCLPSKVYIPSRSMKKVMENANKIVTETAKKEISTVTQNSSNDLTNVENINPTDVITNKMSTTYDHDHYTSANVPCTALVLYKPRETAIVPYNNKSSYDIVEKSTFIQTNAQVMQTVQRQSINHSEVSNIIEAEKTINISNGDHFFNYMMTLISKYKFDDIMEKFMPITYENRLMPVIALLCLRIKRLQEQEELISWLATANNSSSIMDRFIGPLLPLPDGPVLPEDERVRILHEILKEKYNIADALITDPHHLVEINPYEKLALAKHNFMEEKTFHEICFAKAFKHGSVITITEYIEKYMSDHTFSYDNPTEMLDNKDNFIEQPVIVASECIIRNREKITVLNSHINVSLFHMNENGAIHIDTYVVLTLSKNKDPHYGIPTSIDLGPVKYIKTIAGYTTTNPNHNGRQYAVALKIPFAHDVKEIKINVPVTKYINGIYIKQKLLQMISTYENQQRKI